MILTKIADINEP